jgi:hypothetical protein
MLRPEPVRELLGRFQAGDRSLANPVLSLVALQLWWDDYFGPERVY